MCGNGLPSFGICERRVIGEGPLGLPSGPLAVIASRDAGTEIEVRTSATANRRRVIFTV